MDAVFALQRSGSDAVFAYQFPVAAAQSTGGWGHLPIPEPFRERERAVPKVVLDLEDAAQAERAAEIAAATVARARATDPSAVVPPELPVPESLARIALPLDSASLLVQIQTTALPVVPLPVAPRPDLDEEAILAATVLLMRRRLTR